MRYVDRLFTSISIENLKHILFRIAYLKKNTLFEKIDPRMLMAWYVIFAILPWLFHNGTTLLLLAGFAVGCAMLAKVSRFILFLMTMSMGAHLLYLGIVTLFMGGQLEAFWALFTFTIKLLMLALISVAVFASMDPERFSDTMLALGFPPAFSFGVSYGYRMLPLLVEEYNNIILSYRMRGRAPRRRGFLYSKQIVYFGKIAIKAFYPMMLNTAKRTRTTVEALECKGFTYSGKHPEAKRIRLAYMKVKPLDWLFLVASGAIAAALIAIGERYPL
ncbi:energy-coupling factor transporter transmembrane protein EcfT [Paenibacillus sp. TRM 82003]|nr:energy-coupling factor transporter transmembrane protein EcfT [Paenibacillus sp. TRM 82003]